MMYPPGDFAPWLGIFETVRVFNGVPLFATNHLVELRRAARALDLPIKFDLQSEREKLPKCSGRWRWIVTTEETHTLFTEEPPASPRTMAISLSPLRVGSQNWDSRFKTLSHLLYTQAWQTAPTPEVILLNENGHVASASRSNIFWRIGDRVRTPAHAAGCRRGVVRGFVSERETVLGGHFPLKELLEADEVFLTNSMRGIISVSAMEGRKLKDFSCAQRLRRAYEAEVAARLRKLSP